MTSGQVGTEEKEKKGQADAPVLVFILGVTMELYKTDKSKYTVILCSFYGSPARVRQKYADLWVSKGCSVVTLAVGAHVPNSRAVHAEPTNELIQRAKQALDTLIANELDRKFIIFHIISEGGISSWLRVMNFLDSSSLVRFLLYTTFYIL